MTVLPKVLRLILQDPCDYGIRHSAALAHVSLRQRRTCRRSPARPRFPVGYTLPGSALARFADTSLYPLIVALLAKLAEASFAVNLAIPLQDRGNSFDDLGVN